MLDFESYFKKDDKKVGHTIFGKFEFLYCGGITFKVVNSHIRRESCPTLRS